MRKISVALALVAFGLVACDDSGTSSTEQNADTEQVSSSSDNTTVEYGSSSSVVANDSRQSSSSEKESAAKSSSSSEGASTQGTSNSGMQSSSSELSDNSSSSERKITYGIMTDSRDGQTYKTVKIGDQTWMAQNLNYETANSYCYNDDPTYCVKFGRFYIWAAAMDSAGKWSTNGKGCGYRTECSPIYPVRGVCPKDWHLPDTTEWKALFDAVGGKSTAGKILKSQSGWKDFVDKSGNGTDAFGFSALPADLGSGFCDSDNDGCSALFWSSTENHGYNAYAMHLYFYEDDANLGGKNDKYFEFSVRCLKD